MKSLFATRPETRAIPAGTTAATLTVYEDHNRLGPKEGLQVVILEIPEGHYDMRVEGVSRYTSSIVSEFEKWTQIDDLAVLTGGYCQPCQGVCSPEGMLCSDGKCNIKDTHTYKLGGFLVSRKPGSLEIIANTHDKPSREHKSKDDPDQFNPDVWAHSVLQLKTILVWDGTANKNILPTTNAGTPYNRLAIGLRRNHDVVIVGAFRKGGALSLYEFANLLVFPKTEHGPGAERALNLEGADTTHIFIPAGRIHFTSSGGIGCVPDIIHLTVYPRIPPQKGSRRAQATP